MNLWPHQQRALDQLAASSSRRVVVTSPTGGGKSLIMQKIIEQGKRTTVFANRVALVEQLAHGLNEAGIQYGMQASGYAPDSGAGVQIASIQTVDKRIKAGKATIDDAEIVLLDECHNETGERSCEILDKYTEQGARVIGVTATPIGIGHMFDDLIVAGTTSELRKCGALVAAQTYAPDEPDVRALKAKTKGILQLRDEVKEVMLHTIFGRVIEHYHRLNPDQLPTILFAPGVDESAWFCEQFNAQGIPWSHIDGSKIIINGETMSASRENRELLKAACESGRTKGVSNRFVMREGVNWPFLAHGIFACTFGSVASYIQAGGRLLRNHDSLENVTIQDHGGNFWRHDSLNDDREWHLEDTYRKIQDRHDEVFRTKAEPEPIVCPKCAKIRRSGVSCPQCGFTYRGRQRTVVQTDGSLREVHGDVYRKRVVNESPEAHKKWTACVFRCKNSDRTFNQARALFQRENSGTVPGSDFPLMPQNEADWYAKVRDVPFQRLSRKQGAAV